VGTPTAARPTIRVTLDPTPHQPRRDPDEVRTILTHTCETAPLAIREMRRVRETLWLPPFSRTELWRELPPEIADTDGEIALPVARGANAKTPRPMIRGVFDTNIVISATWRCGAGSRLQFPGICRERSVPAFPRARSRLQCFNPASRGDVPPVPAFRPRVRTWSPRARQDHRSRVEDSLREFRLES
jgi:hypothetical protein